MVAGIVVGQRDNHRIGIDRFPELVGERHVCAPIVGLVVVYDFRVELEST